MSNPRRAYQWLRRHSVNAAHLASAMGLLGWDQQTMLPTKGHAARADQMAALTGVLHKLSTDKRIGTMLSRIEGSDLVSDPISTEAVNVREWRREYDQSVKIPAKLAMALAHAAAEGHAIWEKARAASDWSLFAPNLEKQLALAKEKAECLGYAVEPFDALFDDFEPGETAAAVEPLFARLRAALVPLIEKARKAGPAAPLAGEFPVDAQEAFLRSVIADIGFDFESGRLDTAAHPFSSKIAPGDARITTRFDPKDFTKAFFGAVHETGHALYSLGCPDEHFGTPLGRSISLGIHESQSRMWENMVARSRPFWERYLPKAKERFKALGDVRLETFLAAVNRVEPGFIRVDADEATYNLHIMLRFELELALFRGELAVNDIPAAWNEKMRGYLGITPPSDAQGALQDVHWSMGAFAYFPTYTLGNMYAAQFFQAAGRDLGDLGAMFSRGAFSPLLSWLRENIHRRGRTYRPRDLVRTVTGEDLSPEPLIRYLEGKYGE